jgi:hypothetical protein
VFRWRRHFNFYTGAGEKLVRLLRRWTHSVTIEAILETPRPSVSFYFSPQPCNFLSSNTPAPLPYFSHHVQPSHKPKIQPRLQPIAPHPPPLYWTHITPHFPSPSPCRIHAGTTSRFVSASIRASCRATISRTGDGVWLNTITTGPADARRSATRARGEMWRWWDEGGLGIEYVGLCNGGGSGIGIGVVRSEVGELVCWLV